MSSKPARRVRPRACGSAIEPTTDAVASSARPAATRASRRSAASAAASSLRKPSTGAHAERLSSKLTSWHWRLRLQICNGTAAENNSALITSDGRCLPSVASWVSSRSTLASHPWRVAVLAGCTATASPRVDSTNPTAEVIDQATHPSHSTRPAMTRVCKPLTAQAQHQQRRRHLKDVGCHTGGRVGGLVDRRVAQRKSMLQVFAQAHRAECGRCCIAAHRKQALFALGTGTLQFVVVCHGELTFQGVLGRNSTTTISARRTFRGADRI
jgi:hypothetical protein